MENKKRPLIIAHRGASYSKKENSLEAYQKALKMGVDGIEMDLRQTADGVVVCHHDRGVKNGEGERFWIDKLSWREVRRITNGEIIKLEKVIRELRKNERTKERKNEIKKNKEKISQFRNFAISHIILDLDLKQEGMEKEIARILKKYKIKKVMVNSTDVWTLKAFEDVYPQAKLALSYHPADPRDLANHKTIRFLALLAYYSLKPLLFRLIRRKTAIGDIQAASLNYRLVSKKVVQFLQQYHIKVFAWGTEDIRKLRWLVNLGVDGVKTRRPDLLKQILMSNS